MMYRANTAKHAPLENLRSCDWSMQSPSCHSCADGCLAGDVYLDIFKSWCVPARILYL